MTCDKRKHRKKEESWENKVTFFFALNLLGFSGSFPFFRAKTPPFGNNKMLVPLLMDYINVIY